jgi:hypothetical protein
MPFAIERGLVCTLTKSNHQNMDSLAQSREPGESSFKWWRHMMICSVTEASEQAIFGIIRGGATTFTREVS